MGRLQRLGLRVNLPLSEKLTAKGFRFIVPALILGGVLLFPGGRAHAVLNWITCGACPEAPEVSITGDTIVMGQINEVEGGLQNTSVHGAAALLPPARAYRVTFSYDLRTWDSYNTQGPPGTGYWDSFSVSISQAPYWQLNVTDPVGDGNDPLGLGFIWGGTRFGDGFLESNSGELTVEIPASPSADNYLNVVLDTQSLPNANHLYPSWGTITIVSVEPVGRLPVILVPGYPGTELVNTQDFHLVVDDGHGGVFDRNYAAGEVVWVNPDRVCDIFDTSDDYLDVGKLQSDGITAVDPFLVPSRAFEAETIRCPIPPITITPDQFGGIISHLEGLGYRRGVNLFTFGYDFRKDVGLEGWPPPPYADPRSAPTILRLDVLVDQAMEASGANKVVLIGHSLGGLAIRQYLLDPTRANKVTSVIVLGTPFIGTAKALLALEKGLPVPEEWFGLVPSISGFGIDRTEVKDLIRNFPAHYEILPTSRYFQFYDFYVNEVSWDFNGDGVNSGPLNYDLTRQGILRNHDPDANIVSMAERFHAQGMDWSQSPPGVEINILAGCGTGTTGRLYAAHSIQFMPPSGVIVKRDLIPEGVNGDGTVVLHSTDLFDPARGLDFRGNARVFYAQNLKHGQLLTSSEAHQFISFLLGETTVRPSVILDQPCELNGWGFAVFSPVELHIIDSQGRHTGLLDLGIIEESIAGSNYEVLGDIQAAFVQDGDIYQIELRAIGSGVFDFVIQELVVGVVRTMRFEDVEVNATSRAVLTLDTRVDPQFRMMLDRDGDGTFETELGPTVILNAQESQDRTAPTINIVNPSQDGAYVCSVPFDWEIVESGSGLLNEVGILDPVSPQPQLVANHSQVEVPEGTHIFRVVAEDRAGNGAVAEVTFRVLPSEAPCPVF